MSNNEQFKILIIEDEKPIQRFLSILTSGHGYDVKSADNGKDGLWHVVNWKPNLILLDLGLPDTDGLDFTRQLRTWTETPIIVISARDKESEKVQALDVGANDYLTKPFGSEELLARIRVALRWVTSSEQQDITEYRFGNITIDLVMQQITRDDELLHVTPTEYKIVTLLAKNMGKVLTHKQILKDVWGDNYSEHSHYVRVHVAQLRHKIEAVPAQPKYLITETGVGYRLLSDH
ncbi:DNA-binding response regulator [Photobacterium profundum]|uniref:DNA-binding response regulator n=1 Tax=Photobacterium profundum 3TCK TaxID=314280 RepID=Q1Z633_9GAMM|nr:response regulator [Photobacterium profundum]EAS44011.1 DNA-binding response regulator [Photobacterium profundum 3TCK]PSV61798.1 DNA-binding response regulator [Photobacterium profundum]